MARSITCPSRPITCPSCLGPIAGWTAGGRLRKLPPFPMRARNITYWISTVLVVALLIMSAMPGVLRMPVAVQGIAKLGYPTYFATYLGIWKLLGVLALLWPRTPVLKEWAYAGIFIDFVSAMVACAYGGQPWLPIILCIVVLAVSWGTRPESRRLGAPPVSV